MGSSSYFKGVKTALFSFLILFSTTLIAQKYLVLNDGSSFQYEAIRPETHRTFIRKTGQTDFTEFPNANVLGVLNHEIRTFTFLESPYVKKGLERGLLMHQLLEGPIELYSAYLINGNQTTALIRGELGYGYMIACKDSDCRLIQHENHKPARLESMRKGLRALFADDPGLLAALDTLPMRTSTDMLWDLVLEYNMGNHELQIPGADEETSKVVFFRFSMGQTDETATIEVNGERHELKKNSKVELELPTETLCKACIKSGEEASCTLMRGQAGKTRYFQLSLNRRGKYRAAWSHPVYAKNKIEEVLGNE